MELFERVKQAATEEAGSNTKLAGMLGIPQPTFQGYLKESRQDNLWPLLPRIIEVLPKISREWLYFGEGEMLRTYEKTQAPPSGPDVVNAMEKRYTEAREEVSALKDEVLNLQRKLLAMHETVQDQQRESQRHGGLSTTAPTGTTVLLPGRSSE